MRGFSVAMAVAAVAATGCFAVAQGTRQGDAAKGKQVFAACSDCHALDHAVVGPPLGGVIGRKAGAVDGYSYSRLMTAAGDAGLVWSEAEIVDYLENPTAFLTRFVESKGRAAPGSSKMIFKLADETQRRNVAAYLASTTKSPPRP